MKVSLFTTAAILSAGVAAAGGHEGDALHWTLVATVQPGKAADVLPLVTRMSEATEASEDGTLIYEYMLSGDTVHIYERYADSAAALTHLGNFGANFAGDFLATFSVESISVYGPAGDDLKAALDGFPVTYFDKISGFSR